MRQRWHNHFSYLYASPVWGLAFHNFRCSHPNISITSEEITMTGITRSKLVRASQNWFSDTALASEVDAYARFLSQQGSARNPPSRDQRRGGGAVPEATPAFVSVCTALPASADQSSRCPNPFTRSIACGATNRTEAATRFGCHRPGNPALQRLSDAGIRSETDNSRGSLKSRTSVPARSICRQANTDQCTETF
jgi:hypothetical protein